MSESQTAQAPGRCHFPSAHGAAPALARADYGGANSRHFVREKCAAGLVVLKYLETALQVADMFTKQIFPKHFERLRRVMMGHENFDDMRARYVQVKASGDDMDDPKLYVDSKPGRPPK